MLFCPHCDREFGVGHDFAGCKRKMSRRFFLGMLGIAAAIPVVAKVPALEFRCGPKLTVDLVIENSEAFMLDAFRSHVYIRDQMDVADTPLFTIPLLLEGLHARSIQGDENTLYAPAPRSRRFFDRIDRRIR